MSARRSTTEECRRLLTSSCQRWGARIQRVQLCLNGNDELRKFGLQLPFDRRSRFAFLESRDRIDRSTVLRHHEVKMRARSQTGLSDQSNELPLFDHVTGTYAGCD